jgi:pimeloyl-ACP methyl ester carboxylesterase
LPKFCSKSATIATVEAGFVEAAGTRLFVRRFGEEGSPAVFYWHGGGGGSTEWPHFAPALEAAGYSVYAPEAPGYGSSLPVEPDRYRASAVADLAIALIDALDIAPVIWAGYSWGGNVGIHALVRAPDRISGLALLDGGYLLPEDDPDYDPSLDFEGRIEAWRLELERQEDVDEAPIEIVAAAMAGSNVEPGVPLLPRVEATGIPVLLIAATEPPKYAELRARAHVRFRAAAPSAEIVTVPAGHGIFTEAGEDVRRALLDWLGRKALGP